MSSKGSVRAFSWSLVTTLLLVAALLMAGCSSATPTAVPAPAATTVPTAESSTSPTEVPTIAPAAAPVVLDINGKGFSMDDLQAMTQVAVDYTNKDGETTTYNGVTIADLIKAAKSKGSVLTIVSSDGYEADITLDQVTNQCIIAITDSGMLRSVLPDESSKLQVKDVVKLRVSDPAAGASQDAVRLILATTTSTADSGLLDYLLPDFNAAYNAEVQVVAVGTGQAIAIGKNGDADVLLVHDRPAEDKFVAEGWGVNRQDVMYNDFVLVGPESDPAGINGMTDATAAMAKIAETGSVFCSRGDKSGTHSKELEIWEATGGMPTGDWYLSLGQGMGDTLTVTNEKQGYTLADRGTWLSRMESLDLIILVEGDPILFNPYGLIAVNPEKWPNVEAELTNDFIAWFTSLETQQKIVDYKHESGQSLFIPDAESWRNR